MQLRYKIFSSGGVFSSPNDAVEKACKQAAEFAARLQPDQVVSVAQSHPNPNHAMVTVWYWSRSTSTEKEATEEQADVDQAIRDALRI